MDPSYATTAAASVFSDRLTILVAALLLNVLLCGPYLLHRALRTHLSAHLAPALWRAREPTPNGATRPPPERRFRGMVLTAVVIMTAAVAGFLLATLSVRLFYGQAAEIVLLAVLLRLRQSVDLTR